MDLQTRVAEIEEFLRFAMVEWPKFRPQVQDQIARRCSRCIVSERYMPLHNGVCELCLAAERGQQPASAEQRDTAKMKQELSEILSQYEPPQSKRRGEGNYDALVLFSGGKDSAYLLYQLRKEHPGLRLLAVTIDNGFFSRIALENARGVLERIDGVDHLIFKPRPELYKKTFRHAFIHLNEGGCYTTVDRMDGDLAFDIGRNLAASWAIPLMIAGLSPEQVERILGLKWFETDRQQERQKRTHSAGFRLEDLYSPEEMACYWWDGSRWPEDRIPRVLYPFYAWPYDEQQIREVVVREGLIDPGKDNPLATNNDTIPVMLAVDMAQLGYSGFEPEFAELIRVGKADRQGWLNLFEAAEYQTRQGQFLPHCLDETLTRLGLKGKDVGLPARRPTS